MMPLVIYASGGGTTRVKDHGCVPIVGNADVGRVYGAGLGSVLFFEAGLIPRS